MTTATDATGEQELLFERRGPILILRLNRPASRNALTGELVADLGSALLDAENDPDIRVVVLTATGDRAFCVGMDLKVFSSGVKAERSERQKAGLAAFRRMVRGQITVPLIGAANGTAVGGGLELLLSCDLVVVSAQGKYGLPEVKRGLIASGGGVAYVGSRLPLALALELALTGDYVDGTRVHALGLANRVVPAEQVLDAALALAEPIAANGPLAVAATKEAVRLAAGESAALFDRLTELEKVVFASDDAKEGARAFLEKRTPRWTGR
ncbi:enoyl-CoA hydratase-related protein [Frankia sp. AgPm24]|uniref:Enoyl-CoA hydratase-related protein n=1 Tax=Frankia umida TaxID=573489 RepID=A0ABT0K1D3_9ACTN|nr:MULTISPECIES: enoyl-CoA hydratase-related protein [Frankia]MCK9877344.1 enoyl-CoA hydratase-related protein [Frankia umida]MCK9921990.1 enoyl-CoA hydratase-related protein [Frankia sp. AgPm24]